MTKKPFLTTNPGLYGGFFLSLFAVALLLNAAWEVSHSMLYDWDPVMSEYIPIIIGMALKDALWILVFYLISATVLRDLFWVEKNNRNGFYIMALCGLLFSVSIELHAQATGRWYYGECMPIIPFLGVGFTPVMQMTLLSPFVAWDAWRFFSSLVKKNTS